MQPPGDTEFLSINQFQIDKTMSGLEDKRPMQNSVPQTSTGYASTKHRLLSMVYDSLLLMAVLFVAMMVFLPIASAAGYESGHPVFSIYFLLVCFLFYGGFWTHGGQTLGMKTWKIQLVHEDNKGISWGQAFLRYITALPTWIVIIVGTTTLILDTPLNVPTLLNWINDIPNGVMLAIGLVMLYLDQRPNNWRDRFSHTRIIRLDYSTNAS